MRAGTSTSLPGPGWEKGEPLILSPPGTARHIPAWGEPGKGLRGLPEGGGNRGSPSVVLVGWELVAGGLGTVGCSSPGPRPSQTLNPDPTAAQTELLHPSSTRPRFPFSPRTRP